MSASSNSFGKEKIILDLKNVLRPILQFLMHAALLSLKLVTLVIN